MLLASSGSLRKVEWIDQAEISTSLTNIGSLEVGAFDLVDCSLSVVRFVSVVHVNTRLTEHKRATRNGDANNHIAVHHQLTNHNIDWDSTQCLTYSTNYFQRLILESWYTNLEQTPLNRCQQLPPPYKRLIHDRNETDKRTSSRPT